MDFEACLHCDLNLKDMTLGESNDSFLGHGQQLCEILSRSDTGVKSYGPDNIRTDREGDYYIPPKICLQGYKTLFAGGIETLLGEGYNKIDFVGRIKITYLHVLIPSEKSESC